MKKQTDKMKAPMTLNLGDLISTVSSYSKNNRETVATVADLLASGRVLVHQNNGQTTKALVVK